MFKRKGMTLPAQASGDAPVPPLRPDKPGPRTVTDQVIRGLVFGAVLIGTLLLLQAVMVVYNIRAPRRPMCTNNEKQLGLVFLMYADAHDGKWPPLSPETGVLQPDWSALSEQYFSDKRVLVCPSDERVDEAAVADGRSPGSYYYLGYIVRNEKEFRAFGAAYRQRIAEGGGFDQDLPVPPEYGGGVIRRLSESAIAELAQDPSGADIPVLFERPDNHVPGGMNVLYADGHIGFVEFGESFPSIQAAVDLIDELEQSDE